MNGPMRAVLAGVLLAAGCAAPTQYGGPIPMNPEGLEQRLAWMCGVGQSSPELMQICAPELAPPQAEPNAAPDDGSTLEPAAGDAPDEDTLPAEQRSDGGVLDEAPGVPARG